MACTCGTLAAALIIFAGIALLSYMSSGLSRATVRVFWNGHHISSRPSILVSPVRKASVYVLPPQNLHTLRNPIQMHAGLSPNDDIGEGFLADYNAVPIGTESGRPARTGEPDLVIPQRPLQFNGGAPLATVPLHIGDAGPFNFIVSTGRTTNVISPGLQADLRIVTQPFAIPSNNDIQGSTTVEAAFIKGVKLANEIPIFFFSAVVQDFPEQELASAQGMEVHGMIGMEFLEQCDVSFQQGLLKVFGTRDGWYQASRDPRWKSIDCYPLPQRLMAVQLQAQGSAQPIFAVVDTGRTKSLLNSDAAELLGLDANADMDASIKFELCGVVDTQMEADEELNWRLPLTHSSGPCIPFKTVDVSYSPTADSFLDFATFLPEYGLRSYLGPMAILGQDVLAQRDHWISGNARQLMFFSASI